MQNITAAELILSLIVTWGIGLAPALATRYLIAKGPISRARANWIAGIWCFLMFMLFRVINAAAGVAPQDTTTGLVWLTVFLASAWIMTRGARAQMLERLRTIAADTSASPEERERAAIRLRGFTGQKRRLGKS